jgi:hypothetical protein
MMFMPVGGIMNLIEPEEIVEFERILRSQGMKRQDFAMSEVDTTDPKTDEVLALRGALTVQRKSTGQSRQYITGDGMSWLALFRNDIRSGAFVGQDKLDVRYRSTNPAKSRSRLKQGVSP